MSRLVSSIAQEIISDWKNISFCAIPYVQAMLDLNSVQDKYGVEDGKSIVLYFLSNASTYRGETARRLKTELKRLLNESKSKKVVCLGCGIEPMYDKEYGLCKTCMLSNAEPERMEFEYD